MAVRRGPVVQAVRRDLERLDNQAQSSGLAMMALRLAELLDGADVSERDAAALAGQLRATLAALPKPATPREDRVDQLRARRQARRA